MASPSAEWNRPYRKREQCVALAAALEADPPVRYADALEVGPGYLVPRSPRWDPDTTVTSSCAERPGTVRIDLTEVVPGPAPGDPDLFFHKGGQGYEPPTVPYGHLERTVFASPPRPVFTKAQIDADGADPGSHPGPGAGRAHHNEVVTYRLRPRAIGPSEGANAWLYKDPKRYPPGTRLSGAKYSKYGDAGPWQGTRDEHFAYLCWSWVRQDGLSGAQSLEVDGGGAVRTLLPPDQVVHRCDVDSVTAPAWNRRGDILGRVVAIYVRATIGASDLYGWMVHSHIDFTGHSAVRRLHVVRA